MKLLAAAILATVLFVAMLRYCFRGGQVSQRPGALYILGSAIACEALLVSLIAMELASFVRDYVAAPFAGTGDLHVEARADPSGSMIVAAQEPILVRPASDDADSWLTWQRELRFLLAEQVYDLDLAGSWIGEVDLRSSVEAVNDGLIRRQVSIPAVDGAWIPAVVLLPANATRPLPGVVILPGHVKPGESGLAQMVLPVDSYQRSAAMRLAQAGFVTITIELRGFGMLGPPRFPEHRVVAYNAILAGDFYKKLIFQDIKRALDFFVRQPEVDRGSVGISGVSLGAELAVEYAALDQRIRAVSFHSHGGRTGPYRGASHASSGQLHYCHIVPGANRFMRIEDTFLLLAPRPTQGLRGGKQPFPDADFEAMLRKVWSLHGETGKLELANIEGEGHVYFVDEAIRFFRQYLQSAPAADSNSP